MYSGIHIYFQIILLVECVSKIFPGLLFMGFTVSSQIFSPQVLRALLGRQTPMSKVTGPACVAGATMEATLTRQQRLKAIVAGRHDSRGTRFAT
jgi:hypothetical protein